MKSHRHLISKKARILNRERIKGHGRRNLILHTRDFSEIEDSPQAYAIIKKLAAKAGRNAAAEATAAGLSRIFVRNNQVIRVHINGKEEVVVAQLPKGGKFYIKYKHSTVLYAAKK